MISIKKNLAPILPQCKFLCDGKLDQKLDDYELTQYLNAHTTTLFVGAPKSGKTSLLYLPHILNFHSLTHQIFYFHPIDQIIYLSYLPLNVEVGIKKYFQNIVLIIP